MNVPFVNRVSCCYLAFLFAVLSARAGTENFDRVAIGAIPDGWFAGQTGAGAARWKVIEDETAPSPSHVLEQSGVAKFPICVQTNTAIRAGFVAVKFKPISGKEDQAGGVIWRFQDADDYYVARANALEDNVTIYRTVNGERTELKRVNRPVRGGEWHEIRVDYQGSHFRVTLDGTVALEVDDATFQKAGAVGVWTKADSVTLFDEFSFGGFDE